ncbi:DUF423 domain-containing protein [Bacillus benzoevorans]|uniref:Uncharacterized membrane protein YgdD (TMEM256/DUF423 family) n=1 Tax=Bacillus benzoevorans TaxID=1456 RepID=A0A7X0HRC0_9BACI|nr:DUF423 domain-containing protein [Bacillus benzoevorans]MBB6445522.1 uncharacterized membrane protein YgdD (TMEM256/DUF423 family) [Bacillus benzoevorans]
MRVFIMLGAINAMLSVALGAFGAHILEGRLEAYYIDVWGKAVTYQMLHSVGLLAAGILAGKLPHSSLLKWSGWLMFIGIILFSGSLYVLAVTKISILGAITPLGGVSFILSWLFMVIAAKKYL